MEDGERGVPVVVRDEALERRQHAVEELADGLAAEKAGLVRDDASKGVHELVLKRVQGNLREAPALDLA